MIKAVKENGKSVFGEFIANVFVSFWGLGLVIPLTLGYIGSMFEFALWFGVAFAITIILFVPVSGAHLNPEVTLAYALTGRFDKKLVIPYWIAEILGWGTGVMLLYILFGSRLDMIDGINPAELFVCNVNSEQLLVSAVFGMIITAALVFGVLAFFDESFPMRPSESAAPWMVGILIAFLIIAGEACYCGAMNSGRDLGPRIAGVVYGLIKGYDVSAIFGNVLWITDLAASMVGALLGVGVNRMLHWLMKK